MRILVPEHLEPEQRDLLRHSCPGIDLSILRVERSRPFPLRILASAARRVLPYRAYQPLRSRLERADVSVRVDGDVLASPRGGIEALLATWVLDAGTARRVVRLLPDLRWVHSTVTGVDHFDLDALAGRGIVLTGPRSVHARRIAEFVLALVYADAKNVPEHVEATRRRHPNIRSSRELAELTVGIVGFGAIGRAVAGLARANGIRVAAYVRDESRGSGIEGVETTSDLVNLLKMSDVLVLALPLTPRTHGVIGQAEIGALKPDAMLVNVGRGGTIVEEALVRALRERRLRRACLDVVEDPLSGRPTGSPPRNHPFYGLGNVILTGYSASESMNASPELMADFTENLRRYQQGTPLRGRVDLKRGY
jgi:phosphoglycerate dehydrogenase-like enzyme